MSTSAFMFQLTMSLTNYSSPVKEVWARPIVVKCLLLVNMTVFSCPGVWSRGKFKKGRGNFYLGAIVA